MADFSFEEVGKILRALERLDCTSVYLECGDLKLEVSRDTAAAVNHTEPTARPPVPESHAAHDSAQRTEAPTTAPPPAADDIPPHWVSITAPMVGTFYRAPGPGEPPFVEVGDAVSPGRTVGMLEVMKLFTEVKAEIDGKVARIDADDATLVESGRTLVWIERS